MKKYVIREDGRIQALQQGTWGPSGTIGGFVEKEDNLSHNADCWVSGNASVSGDARVSGNASVYGDAYVHGNASVYGDASVSGNASVSGGSVSGGSVLSGQHEWIIKWAYCDGYSKIICEVEGVAMIGAGCRWFTLAEAIEHWNNHSETRDDTVALLEGAKAIADKKGLKYG